MQPQKLAPSLFFWKRRILSHQVDFWLGKFSSTEEQKRISLLEKPGSGSVLLRIYCQSLSEAKKLQTLYRGQIETLKTSDWLQPKRRTFSFPPYFCITSEPLAPTSLPSIHIPAGLAFGTGEHATTSMCLRQLTRLPLEPGALILDVGTGSGILALAAALLGYRVKAIDNDPDSIREARANALANPHIPQINWQHVALEKCKPTKVYDLVIANLYADCLTSQARRLHQFLKPKGLLLVSGILRSQAEALIQTFAHHRLELTEKKSRGKWVCLVFKKLNITT